MIVHVYRINCDCACYWDARSHPVPVNKNVRCKYCKRSLGCMQAEYVGRFESECYDDAIKAAKQQMMDKGKSL